MKNRLDDNESVAMIVDEFRLRNPGFKARIVDGDEGGHGVVICVTGQGWEEGMVGELGQIDGRIDLWLVVQMEKMAKSIRRRSQQEEFVL